MTAPSDLRDVPTGTLAAPRTLTRAAMALALLATVLALGVVLPAETGRDPLGTGRLLGLDAMGRIKVALAAEAAREAAVERASGQLAGTSGGGARGATPRGPARPAGAWRDSMSVTLVPREGIEVKLRMQAGDSAVFVWRTDGAPVYYDLHGEPPNAPRDEAPHRYRRGTAPADSGDLVAAFDGVHGWFWRNRNDAPLTITLRTRGAYFDLKELP